MTTPRRTALITGASAGIGEAFADVFAARGFDLALTARRQDRLETLAGALSVRHGVRVHVIPADLSTVDGAEQVCGALAAQQLVVDVLVNNAGYGVPGTYVGQPWERHRELMQVMVTSVTELTHRLLPGMIERRYGRILNVASLAALVPAPGGHTVYPASKAFVVKFSEALADEVRPFGVHVTALCPGFTLSEFHDVTGTRASVSRMPPWMWMDAPTVARQGYDAVMRGTPVYVNGRVNRALAALAKYVPYGIVTGVGRRLATVYRKSH